MLSGIFATSTLRNCSGPSPKAHAPACRGPAFGDAPQRPQTALRGPRGPSPAGRPRPGPKAPQRRSSGRLRAWKGPRRGGGLRVSLRSPLGRPPGLRCSSRRALRRSRFQCPLGFPFSLSPSLYLHSINRHPPCQALRVCPSPHFQAPYDTVGYPSVKQRGPHFSYVDVTYPSGTYPYGTVTYRRVTLLPGSLHQRNRSLHPSKLP